MIRIIFIVTLLLGSVAHAQSEGVEVDCNDFNDTTYYVAQGATLEEFELDVRIGIFCGYEPVGSITWVNAVRSGFIQGMRKIPDLRTAN